MFQRTTCIMIMFISLPAVMSIHKEVGSSLLLKPNSSSSYLEPKEMHRKLKHVIPEESFGSDKHRAKGLILYLSGGGDKKDTLLQVLKTPEVSFYLIWGIITTVVVNFVPFGTLGYRVLACVIGYNVALFTIASRNKYQRWGQEWLDIYQLLVPLSLVMFLPDEFQYYQGVIEYNIGPPFVGLGGHVSLVMPAGMWTIALFPLIRLGQYVAESKGRREAGFAAVAIAGTILFAFAEGLCWKYPGIWTTKNCLQLAWPAGIMKMAWFSIVADLTLALLTYALLTYAAAKDVAISFPTKCLSAIVLMLAFTGAASIANLLIDIIPRKLTCAVY